PHARLRADLGDSHLDAGAAERTRLRLARAVVEVHLLVRAPGHTLPPAAAPVLVHQHDAVLAPLVHRAGGTRGHARRVETVFADPRQVEHEGLFELRLDDRKSTRLNSSHVSISYAVFCLKK